jgi:N-acetylglucosaminyl-diphospho-decaprenol L-rhamnosyltransferase
VNTNSVELSIIIVNWNSATLLRKCLQSILSVPAGIRSFEVLVIDNASFDGSDEMVSKEFSQVRFIQSEENIGFAAGNNLAFKQSRGEYVLFLNPDAEIIGEAVGAMLDVVKGRVDAGVIGPKLVNPDLTVQVDCMRAFPTILNQLVDSSFTRTIFGRFNFAGVKPVMCEIDGPVGVEMLPGTCIMLRRDVFEEVGGFNERYFMYAEDVELSYNVRLSGRTNYYVASAAVIHHGGKSSEQRSESFFSTVMIREAMWQFLCATRGRFYASLYRITTCLAALARLTLLLFSRPLPANHGSNSRAARSTRKWIKILRWSLGREDWARGYRPVPQGSGRAVAV